MGHAVVFTHVSYMCLHCVDSIYDTLKGSISDLMWCVGKLLTQI